MYSVDHRWLNKIMLVHRFPVWICEVVRELCAVWNTRIVANIQVGNGTSPVTSFNSGLPKGDALWPRLFTLCLNPVAWKLCSTEGYRLSRPVRSKFTNLLYIDDLKVFAASQAKLNIVLKMTKEAMEYIGLQWSTLGCNGIQRSAMCSTWEGVFRLIHLKGSSQGRRSSIAWRKILPTGSSEHRNGYFKKKSWLCSVLPRPTCRDSRLSGRAHCQTQTELKRPISLPCQCCRTLCGLNTGARHTCATSIDRHGRSYVRVVASIH